MKANPRTPHALDRRLPTQQRVLTLHQLRDHGVSAASVAARCRPGGPWQQLLPQVYLLHPGRPSSQERLQAALLYAGRDPQARGPRGGGREAMVTGLAALALHRFSCVPPLPGLPRIDVLVPHQRRLRDAGEVSIHRAGTLPRPQEVTGLPCAPVPRALADAVADLDDTETVRRLLTEAVRGGHCDAAAVLHELAGAGLLERPQVAAAVGALRRADRTMAEQRLYTMVRGRQLPDPVWNVELRLPGGPPLGSVDAYWPEHAVALAIDPRTGPPPGVPYAYGTPYGAATDDAVGEVVDDVYADPFGDALHPGERGETPVPAADFGDDEVWSRCVRQRERLEALGITLLHVTPAKLRDAEEQQAAVVRTALVAAADQLPAAYVVVIPR
ncbi:hypothetical protein [Actinacidiphila bryophytorum]|uniref:PF13338 domain protein n=1 Tax=Actinacidiphila bryophytorum TaxID=1436133 RepID=A0A9W4GY23_9ACTN|nr:hypothetical protein [Actinacidiphila bryophytorum]MBM9434488.1 hypothetical protein [Actinacidiphila bryophytorum]MBN6543716.1 hypothetical protein [Actinacidiphila bryophytorum]CAG7626630.1 conserved hypothetical protein [Actinacidiphila bryophytorum]